jgi:cytosine/adenosine deaminase-related metal-dependent hydrolase
MTSVYCARWILPITAAPILEGAIAIDGRKILAVGQRVDLLDRLTDAHVLDLGDAAILPGLVNAHSHLELTAMRGFLDAEDTNFAAWLRKLTAARGQLMTPDDLYVSAAWGACEAARAGITCVGDASDAGLQSLKALHDVGLRGTIFQESFGPDPRLAKENFENLETKVQLLREVESTTVRAGVSPHSSYTVCALQLEMIASFATAQKLPLMMHAAESAFEDMFMREGRGPLATNLQARGIEWQAPGCSTVQYLLDHGVLDAQPLLAHCINVDEADLESIRQHNAAIAHCPKSNAKLGHGRAPFLRFLEVGCRVGFGSDSVASNNTCDILEEARFATLMARGGLAQLNVPAPPMPMTVEEPQWITNAADALRTATAGGAQALGLEGQIGELGVGMEADFIAVSLTGSHQLPVYDPTSTLIFSSSGRDVILTVVAGREIFREGRILTVDEERLRARMRKIGQKLIRT